MKYVIEYHYIKSDHIMAMPELDHKEFVETEDPSRLEVYLKSQTDNWGNRFKKGKSFGFDYTSTRGAVRVKNYIPPKFKQL